MKIPVMVGAAAVAALCALPAYAQQVKTVDGVVINFGLMSAEKAIHAEGHRTAHPDHFPGGSQHVLITLDEAKSGRRIGDAEVMLEVVDPQGKVVKKPLLHTSAAGMPDYSELFIFGWSGKYTVRATVTTKPGAKPLKASFTLNHEL
jgi:hypothetical protein